MISRSVYLFERLIPLTSELKDVMTEVVSGALYPMDVIISSVIETVISFIEHLESLGAWLEDIGLGFIPTVIMALGALGYIILSIATPIIGLIGFVTQLSMSFVMMGQMMITSGKALEGTHPIWRMFINTLRMVPVFGRRIVESLEAYRVALRDTAAFLGRIPPQHLELRDSVRIMSAQLLAGTDVMEKAKVAYERVQRPIQELWKVDIKKASDVWNEHYGTIKANTDAVVENIKEMLRQRPVVHKLTTAQDLARKSIQDASTYWLEFARTVERTARPLSLYGDVTRETIERSHDMTDAWEMLMIPTVKQVTLFDRLKSRLRGILGPFKKFTRGIIIGTGGITAMFVPMMGLTMLFTAMQPVLEILMDLFEVFLQPLMEAIEPLLVVLVDWITQWTDSQKLMFSVGAVLALLGGELGKVIGSVLMLSAAGGALADTLVGFKINILDIVNVIPQMIEGISGLVKIITDVIIQAMPAIIDALFWIIPMIRFFIESIVPHITPVIIDVMTIIATTIGDALKTAIETGGQLFAALMSIINVVLRWVDENSALLGQTIMTAFGIAFQWLSDNWQTLVTYLTPLFNNVFSWLTENISLFTPQLISFISAIGEEISKYWNMLISSFQIIFGKVIDAVSALLTTSPDKLVTLLKTIGGILQDKWREIQTNLKSLFASVLGWVATVIPEMPELTKIITAIGKWFEINWVKLTGFMNTVFTKLMDFLSDLPFVTSLITFVKALGEWLVANWSILKPYLSDLLRYVVDYIIRELPRMVIEAIGAIYAPIAPAAEIEGEIAMAQRGAYVRRGGLVYVHPHEVILPARFRAVAPIYNIEIHIPATITSPIELDELAYNVEKILKDIIRRESLVV